MGGGDDKPGGPTLLDEIIGVGGELLRIIAENDFGARKFLLIIGLLAIAIVCFVVALL
jgi:hypothetical protein